MKKTLLRKAVLGLGLLAIAAPSQLNAQPAPTFYGNPNANYIGTNFSVIAPASIAGGKDHTVSNDGSSSTNNWGRVIDSMWLNVPVAKVASSNGAGGVNDSACSTIFYNGQTFNGVSYPSLAGKFAFIRRGSCNFDDKAYNAQQAGAIGIIISNYSPGTPGGNSANWGPAFIPGGTDPSAALVHIPVLMIGDVDGNAMEAQLNANQGVTITLTGWQSGFTHDISILKGGVDHGPAYAIPLSQLDASNNNPNAYKMFTGAFIGNFGTSNESGAKLVNHVTFTPTGGAASQVWADSVNIGSFTTIDSIKVPLSPNTYDLHPTTTGRYDANYTLSENNGDESPNDNVQTSSMYVTDSIYSKTRFDFTAGKPLVLNAYGPSTASDFVWGPMYFIAKGGYAARKVQFSVAVNSATNLGNLPTMNIYLFRWVDGQNGFPKDNTIQKGELIMSGIATKVFTVNDSNRTDSIITLTWKNVAPNAATTPVRLVDTSWYWVAADVSTSTFLGCDGITNYYPRAYFQSKTAGMVDQMYAPFFTGNEQTFIQSASNSPIRYPFESPSGVVDSVRFIEQDKGVVPAIALHMSKNVVPVGVTDIVDNIKSVTIFPNPAVDHLDVKMEMSKVAKRVWYSVADATGRTITRFSHDNVMSESVSIPTNGLAAGNYYLVINADESVQVRPFAVTSK